MGEQPKIVVIGIDGGTFDIILPLVEKGDLPNLAGFIEGGSWGHLKSTIPSITMPAWPSLLTGVNPAKHGVFFFKKDSHGTYDEGDFASAADLKAKGLWDLLGDRKAIFNGVPSTYPPPLVNGLAVSAFRPLQQEQFKTHPPELAAEVRKVLGLENDRIESFSSTYGQSGKRGYLARISRFHTLAVERLTRLNLHLMEKIDWSFLMTVYMSTDVVQHFCWALMDDTHPRYDSDLAREFGDIIPDVYRKIDAGIGKIARAAGEDTIFVIVSDHGAGPVHKSFEINRWLLQEGFLFLRKRPYAMKARFVPAHSLLARLGLGRLAGLLPEVLGRQRFPWVQREPTRVPETVDWGRTVAYATANGVNINLRGREPQGIVEREAYDTVVDRIKEKLERVVDPLSDRKLVERVYRREEIYEGPHLDEAYDLYIAANESQTHVYHFFFFDIYSV